MVELKKLAKKHKKALVLWAVSLTAFALMLVGVLPMGVSPIGLITGNSMQPTMGFASIVLLDKQIPFEELQVGDIITFSTDLQKQNSHDANQSIIFTHRVYYIDKEHGTITTLGDNNKKQTECEEKTLDKNSNTIEITKRECMQIFTENVRKDQYIGKVIWQATIIP